MSARPFFTAARGVLFAGFVFASATQLASGQATGPGASPRTHALLIGVTRYPNLDRRWWLEGPANDVRLMTDVLHGAPFSVPAANTRVLAGWPAEAAARPTRANIERGFAWLEQVAGQGDHVVVFLAGHGSQQPADDDTADEEPDAMDEIFLPADAAGWDGRAGTVRNAIADDEIRAWVSAIRNKGAFVWLIVDSCQSGTMARGANAERDRRVPTSVLVPDSVMRPAPVRTRGAGSEPALLGLSPTAGGIVALYASQAIETTPEKRLPNIESPWHGLFTYTLASVLQGSSSPMTYRELMEHVVNRYRAQGRFSPNPMAEGGGMDRPVLDQRSWPERPDFVLSGRAAGSRWSLRAGTIHGLTVGSVLEVFPPAGARNADSPVGRVKVVSVEATTAVVGPEPGTAVLPLGAGYRARIVAYDSGVEQLRVGVQRAAATRAGGIEYSVVPEGDGPDRLERAASALPGETRGLARRARNDAEADWVVRAVDGDVFLIPAAGWGPAPASPSSMLQSWTPLRIGEEADPMLPLLLGERVRRIARARNLLALATRAAARTAAFGFDVELLRFEGTAAEPVPVSGEGRTLRAGETVAFTLRNRSSMPLDVTLLLVGDRFAIEPLFPPAESATAGRLNAGESRTTGRFTVEAEDLEVDQVVAIAVPASTPPVNFTALAQPAIGDATRGESTLGGRQILDPGQALQALLVDAMYGGADVRRSLTAAEVTDYAMRVVGWRALPATR